MSYQSELKSWGSTGTVYPDNYNYASGEQPDPGYDNFFAYNVIKDLQHLITQSNDYESHKTQSHAHHDRYSDSEAVSAIESTSINIDGDIDLTGSVDGVNLSSFYSNYDSHTSDGSAHHAKYTDSEAVTAVESTTLGDLTIGGQETFENSSNDFWRINDASGGSNTSPHTARFDGRDLRFYAGDGTGTVFQMSQNGTVNASAGPLQESGNRVATRSWTNSNFNNYSDSEAISAVEGSDLSIGNNKHIWGDYEIRPSQNENDGLAVRARSNPSGSDPIFTVESSGSATRLKVTQSSGTYAEDGLYENGNQRVASRSWANNNFNNYSHSDARSAVSGSNIQFGSYIGFNNDNNVIEHIDGNNQSGPGWSNKDALNFQSDGSMGNIVLRSGYIEATQGASIDGNLNIPVHSSEPSNASSGDIAIIGGELMYYE